MNFRFPEDVFTRPFTSSDVRPPTVRQGANRFERFKNFRSHLEKYPEWKKHVPFHVFEGIGHKEDHCCPDPELLDFIFERDRLLRSPEKAVSEIFHERFLSVDGRDCGIIRSIVRQFIVNNNQQQEK